MTFKTNLRPDWQRQDPGAGDNSTCTLLPDPDSCEGAWLARLVVNNDHEHIVFTTLHYSKMLINLGSILGQLELELLFIIYRRSNQR